MTPEELRDHLQEMIDGWAALGHPALLERFIVRNGKAMQAQPRPKGIKRGRPKACYWNASNLVHLHPGLTYCEGYVCHEQLPIPIHHAWAWDGERVVDNTFAKPQEYVYWGVPFEDRIVLAEQAKHRVYGLLDLGHMLNSDLIAKLDPECMRAATAITKEQK